MMRRLRCLHHRLADRAGHQEHAAQVRRPEPGPSPSSFIRTRSWSRVIPALLTRTSMRPKRSPGRLDTRRWMSSPVPIRRHREGVRAQRPPAPGPPRRPARRPGQRLRPRRRRLPAAGAMASPMPRSPPVTMATLPARARPGSRVARHRRQRGQRLVEDGGILDRVAAQRSSSVRLSSPVSTAPAPPRGTRSRPRAPGARRNRSSGPGSPPAGPGTASPRPRSRGDPGVHVADDRDARGADRDALQLRGQAIGRRLHQRAVEGRAHRRAARSSPAARRGRRDRALDRACGGPR